MRDLWAVFAMLSALAAGANVVLSKKIANQWEPVMLSAVRTAMVLLVSLVTVTVFDEWEGVGKIGLTEWAVIAGSGAATAAAWLCYFRALAKGSAYQVGATDKLSVVLTFLGGWLLLGEQLRMPQLLASGLVLLGIGLMLKKQSNEIDKQWCANQSSGREWRAWALLSALLVSVSTLLSKKGTRSISADVALLLRTCVVLVLTVLVLLSKRRSNQTNGIDKRILATTLISGAITGVGWVFYFRALQIGSAGPVQSVDKLSIWFTAILSRIFLHQRLRPREILGILIVVSGILALYFSSLAS